MTRRAAFMIVFLFLPGASAVADPPDLSTPASAIKSLWSAVAAADADAVRQSLHAEDDLQREVVAAMADLLVAGERLKRAAVERFGEAGAAMGQRMIDVDDVAKLDAAKVEEKGNVATVTIEGASRPLTLRRSAGQWRLVVTGPEGGRPPATSRHASLVRASARAIDEAADEIRKGQHASPQAASAAVEQKLHAVMLDAYRGGATQPATRPAGS